MKKLLILTALCVLLVSCGKTPEPTETATGGEVQSGSGIVVDDDGNAKDPEITASGEVVTGVDVGSNPTKDKKPAQVNSGSGKSEDEIVKDFEKEIDNLLNTIDTDEKKK